MKEYIEFIEMKSALKTRQFIIQNLSHDLTLGRIAWENHWRRYCFYPYGETVWSDDCLSKVWTFIKILNQEHKKKIKGVQ